MSDSEDSIVATDLFQEPEDFFKAPAKPTVVAYKRDPTCIKPGEPTEICVNLVGSSPLWGHLLWNAGMATTDYLDQHRAAIVTGKTVLELGSGAGLPSLVAGLTAKHVVMSDYPDPDLLSNLELNKKECGVSPEVAARLSVAGYIWGNEATELLNCGSQNGERFDLIILSDLIFNHTEHTKLLKSCEMTLKDDGKVFVVFSPHRPKLFHKDKAFFTQAQEEFGYRIIDTFERDYDPMFVEDEETKELRGKVFGYLLSK